MDQNFQFGQQQQHAPSHTFNMTEVLSASHFSLGGDELQFGDASYLNQASHDRPLLDNSEQSMLNNFWEHPDEFKDTIKVPTMPFGYMPSQDAADAVTPSNALHAPHANSANPNSHNSTAGSTGEQQYDNTVTGEDINAASLIHNIRSNSSSSNNGAPAFANPADFSTVGSWGSFLNPMTTDMSGHLENLTMAYTQHWQSDGHINARSQQSAVQQGFDMEQVLQADMRARPSTNNMQYTQSVQQWQTPGANHQYASEHGQSRAHPATFGSDVGFKGTRFQPSSVPANHDKKAGNLLGAPGVGSAVASARPNGRHQGQYGQPAAAWGGVQIGAVPHGNGVAGQARKRRRSQADGEDAADWQTDQTTVKQEELDDEYAGGATGHKRRRSVAGAQGERAVQTSNSPEGDGMRGMKKKENLTDQQKRFNHIQSEKKRRELINNGYNTLNVLVPALAQGKSGLSRSECLAEVNMYLQTLAFGNASILQQLGMPADALACVNRDSLKPNNLPPQQNLAPTQQPTPQQMVPTHSNGA